MSLFLRRSMLVKRFVPVSCVYPLDATLLELQDSGLTGKMSMSNSDKTASYTLTNPGSTQSPGAALSGFYQGGGSVFTRPSGKMAIEYSIDSLPASEEGGTRAEAYGPRFRLATVFLSNTWNVSVKAYTDGTFDVQVTNGFTNSTILTGLSSAPSEIGFVMDYDAGELSVRINGVNYATTSVTATEFTTYTYMQEFAANHPADVGKVFQATLRTQASDFTGSYEPGTTDPCGNVI